MDWYRPGELKEKCGASSSGDSRFSVEGSTDMPSILVAGNEMTTINSAFNSPSSESHSTVEPALGGPVPKSHYRSLRQRDRTQNSHFSWISPRKAKKRYIFSVFSFSGHYEHF